MKKTICSLLIASMLGACATASKDVATTYVSPLQYKDWDCDQISIEMARVSARVTELGGRLDESSSKDKLITGVGVLVFWPALFFLGGNKQQEAEFARLKGEYESLQQTSNHKKCTLPPPAPVSTSTAK